MGEEHALRRHGNERIKKRKKTEEGGEERSVKAKKSSEQTEKTGQGELDRSTAFTPGSTSR
jgi:hypothetical protein